MGRGYGYLTQRAEARRQAIRIFSKVPHLLTLYHLIRPAAGHDLVKITEAPIIHSLIAKPSGRWLDIGYGAASYARLIMDPGASYVGIDLGFHGTPATVEIAQIRGAKKAGFVVGDSQQLPFQDGTFDGVLATQVFEHIPNDTSAANEVSRILKKGGITIISVPCLPAPYPDADHVRPGYTLRSLSGLLVASGLRVLRVGYGAHSPSRLALRILYWCTVTRGFPAPPGAILAPLALWDCLWYRNSAAGAPFVLTVLAVKD